MDLIIWEEGVVGTRFALFYYNIKMLCTEIKVFRLVIFIPWKHLYFPNFALRCLVRDSILLIYSLCEFHARRSDSSF